MKVEVVQYGIIHSNALCSVCDWSCSEYLDMKKVRNKIISHVRKTGHEVFLETGKATRYKPLPHSPTTQD